MTPITRFDQLPLRAEIQRALAKQGYETPTPIQAQAIPPLLEGRDLLGIAQTGTGKTAAFALPILERMTLAGGKAKPNHVRALVLTPTRELAIQIDDNLDAYGAGLPLSHAVIFGGVGQQPQVDALRRGIDILIATPGRLLDLINQGHVRFDGLQTLVLDEADRMLDMGFIHDVKRIIAKLPADRQTLFFSATMPSEVAALSDRLLRDPVRVEVTPGATTAERIVQHIIFVDAKEKRPMLADLLADPALSRAIVFTRTKHGANKVAEYLVKQGIVAAAIHGNKSQSARQNALNGFRDGNVRALIATDIAARGIDVEGVSHVINYELPNIPESYVHRIGRTARAGAEGIAISFCDGEERAYLRDIEKLIRQKVPEMAAPAAVTPRVPLPHDPREERDRTGGGRNGFGGRGGRGGQNGARGSAPRGQNSRGEGSRGENSRGEGSRNDGNRANPAREGQERIQQERAPQNRGPRPDAKPSVSPSGASKPSAPRPAQRPAAGAKPAPVRAESVRADAGERPRTSTFGSLVSALSEGGADALRDAANPRRNTRR